MILAKDKRFLKAIEEHYNKDDSYELRREQVDILAEEFNLKDRAIIQALVRMGIYRGLRSENKLTKKGEEIISKIQLASKIADILDYGATTSQIKSLSLSNKVILREIGKYMGVL